MEDADFIAEFMKKKNIEAYNNRLFKSVENGATTYEVKLFLKLFKCSHNSHMSRSGWPPA